MSETRLAICRLCTNTCGMSVEVEDNHILEITADLDSPLHHGYSCPKGRSQGAMYRHPERLLRPLKRTADGEHVPIGLDSAVAEISSRLRAIVDEHGPASVAIYSGTRGGGDGPVVPSMTDAFMQALGSPMYFDSGSIDQPGKMIAKGFLGIWMGGGQSAHDPDVILLVGNNPLVSHQALAGNPGDIFKEVAQRGGSVIVIDPRRTETANRATLFLQPRPGQDAAILAAMIRVILAEDLSDATFIEENVSGVDDLRRAVEPFTPEYVADRADLDAADIVAAARMFATAGRGYAAAGTGPNMSGNGPLIEYLLLCLDTLCGHWRREGDLVKNAYSLVPAFLQLANAQAIPPFPAYDIDPKLRIRGLGKSLAGLPTSALADEILQEGEGQVRALINLSGNPLNAWPDQLHTLDALKSLELFVTVDTHLWSNARFADYVIAPKLPLEQPTTTLVTDFLNMYGNNCMGYKASFAHYVPPVVDPPENAEVIELWALLYRIAQGMGLQLELYPGFGSYTPGGSPTTLDMTTQPTIDELLDIIHAGSRIPLEEVKQHPHGAFFPDPAVHVGPKMPGWEGRLDVGNTDMMTDLATLAAERDTDDAGYPFRLISRRASHRVNSPSLGDPPKGKRYNPAFMNPADLAALNITTGDVLEICSPRATIVGVAEADDTVKRGVVSMTHCYGDAPGFDDVMATGSNTSRLVTIDDGYSRYSGQPRMSAVPITVRRCNDVPTGSDAEWGAARVPG